MSGRGGEVEGRGADGGPGASGPERAWCVCLAADERYSLLLLMTLYTMSKRNGAGLVVRVLGDDLSAATRRSAADLARASGWDLSVVEVGERTGDLIAAGVTLDGSLSRSALARLVLADLIDDRFDRAVYLDVDVHVVGDLAELAAVDLGGSTIAAVSEASSISVERFESHGFDLGDRYLNSGVLVIDIAAWRAAGESDALRRTISVAKPWAEHGDQDYLNAHFARRWVELPAVWNVQSRHFYPRVGRFRLRSAPGVDLRSLWRDRRVVHFNAPRRPWRPNSAHPGRPAYLAAWATGPFRSMRGPEGKAWYRLVAERATVQSAIDAAVVRWGR